MTKRQELILIIKSVKQDILNSGPNVTVNQYIAYMAAMDALLAALDEESMKEVEPFYRKGA